MKSPLLHLKSELWTAFAKPKGDGTEGFVGLVDAIRGAARAEVRSAVTPQAPQVKHVEMYAPGQVPGCGWFFNGRRGSTPDNSDESAAELSAHPDCTTHAGKNSPRHSPRDSTSSALRGSPRPRMVILVRPGTVYIAPGGDAHLEIDGGELPVCRLRPTNPVNGPSAVG